MCIRAYSYTYVTDGAGGLVLLVPDTYDTTPAGYKRKAGSRRESESRSGLRRTSRFVRMGLVLPLTSWKSQLQVEIEYLN